VSEEENIELYGTQPIAKISTDEFDKLVYREFSSLADEVKSKLHQVTSDSESGKNRICAAILKLANGDISKLDDLVIKANFDFRDIVSEAEYPEASKHGFDNRNEEDEKRDYLKDWREYSAWRQGKK
jgi:hypothetical protein